MVSKRGEDPMKVTEYIKAYLEKREYEARAELAKGLSHQTK